MTNQVVRPRIPAKPRRTRDTGALRAVLTRLVHGPCVVAEIGESTGNWGMALGQLQPYARRQVLAALAYGKRRGYVHIEENSLFWCITPAGLGRLMALDSIPSPW